MPRTVLAYSLAALLAVLAGPALAQDRASAAPDCPEPETQAEPATTPDPTEDATAPENTGTTGWSGGTGGSQLGTNTQGATPRSPTWQPPTVRGLDLAGPPEPVPDC